MENNENKESARFGENMVFFINLFRYLYSSQIICCLVDFSKHIISLPVIPHCFNPQRVSVANLTRHWRYFFAPVIRHATVE